ncbi:MAG: tRNA glutamyl-Q(34) synthetase GluQRS [Gammaproteobacteria bacterium]
MSGTCTGRFAPSPTGPLHIGSLLCAVASFLDARAQGGRWLVRIEDLDPPREKPGAAADILRTLEAHGLHWDGAVAYQSQRLALYHEALGQLARDGHAFRCTLSRAQLDALGSNHPGRRYSEAHDDGGQDFAWRLDVPDEDIVFDDRIQGCCRFNLARDGGPFVIRRRDGLFAYQLAVTVDDAAQGVTDIVRGSDLLDSTPRQLLLQRRLGLPAPRHAHIPVLVDPQGNKLGKQYGAAPVTPARRMENLRLVLSALGQRVVSRETDADTPEALLAVAARNWSIDAVPRRISIPVAALC